MLGALRLAQALTDGIVRAPVFAQLPLADGTQTWQARSTLQGETPLRHPLYLYAGYGGSGCASTKTIASRKAICEVLERWAYEVCLQRPHLKTRHAFDLARSTDGMAAFPEIWCFKVREKARFEAIERWALVAWWGGHLVSTSPMREASGIVSVEIATPFGSPCLVLWKDFGDRRAYGFACDPKPATARLRALVELSRNVAVLSRWDGSDLPNDASMIEKRLVFFAANEGVRMFDARVRSSIRVSSVKSEPRLITNEEVLGEWTRYVKVWRTLYEEDPRWDDKDRLDVFRF